MGHSGFRFASSLFYRTCQLGRTNQRIRRLRQSRLVRGTSRAFLSSGSILRYAGLIDPREKSTVAFIGDSPAGS